MTPPSSAARPRTKENSPTCESASAPPGPRAPAPCDRERRPGDAGLRHMMASSHRDDHRQDGQHLPGVDQHADRDEEQAGQQIAQRPDIGVHLMAVLALGQDQASEKRARPPSTGRQPPRAPPCRRWPAAPTARTLRATGSPPCAEPRQQNSPSSRTPPPPVTSRSSAVPTPSRSACFRRAASAPSRESR